MAQAAAQTVSVWSFAGLGTVVQVQQWVRSKRGGVDRTRSCIQNLRREVRERVRACLQLGKGTQIRACTICPKHILFILTDEKDIYRQSPDALR